jgi:hypothetical protein
MYTYLQARYSSQVREYSAIRLSIKNELTQAKEDLHRSELKVMGSMFWLSSIGLFYYCVSYYLYAVYFYDSLLAGLHCVEIKFCYTLVGIFWIKHHHESSVWFIRMHVYVCVYIMQISCMYMCNLFYVIFIIIINVGSWSEERSGRFAHWTRYIHIYIHLDCIQICDKFISI